MTEYVVAVKPSARRTAGGAGEWVNREGPRRRFASKALAREWARELSGSGGTVWIQDAAPGDGSDDDGYLVGGERVGRPTGSDRQQAGIDRFA